jgi:hypothetical protein
VHLGVGWLALDGGRNFLRDESEKRPVYGATSKFQDDPQWRNYILFYEYFHGDNGAGIGASHQTGWSGLVSGLLCLSEVSPQDFLQGQDFVFQQMSQTQRQATTTPSPSTVVAEPVLRRAEEDAPVG